MLPAIAAIAGRHDQSLIERRRSDAEIRLALRQMCAILQRVNNVVDRPGRIVSEKPINRRTMVPALASIDPEAEYVNPASGWIMHRTFNGARPVRRATSEERTASADAGDSRTNHILDTL